MAHDDEQPRERWHLKREIQLGHLITTMTVAVSVVVYVGKLEQRISLIEQQAVLQDKAGKEVVSMLRQQLERMDTKLDRLIERERRSP